MKGARYHAVTSADDIPLVMHGIIGAAAVNVGRALTMGDAEKFAEALNNLDRDLRERILSEVTDAIENCFEEQS